MATNNENILLTTEESKVLARKSFQSINTDWVQSSQGDLKQDHWIGIERNGLRRLIKASNPFQDYRITNRSHDPTIDTGRDPMKILHNELFIILQSLASEIPISAECFTGIFNILTGRIIERKAIVDIIFTALQYLNRVYILV